MFKKGLDSNKLEMGDHRLPFLRVIHRALKQSPKKSSNSRRVFTYFHKSHTIFINCEHMYRRLKEVNLVVVACPILLLAVLSVQATIRDLS